MYNRETRRGSPSNFVYVGNEIEVDSSVVLKQSFCRQNSRMKYRQGKAVFEYENIARPLTQTPNGKISEVAFADIAAIPQPSRNYIFSRRCREFALRIFLPLLMLFALPIMNSCEEPDNPLPPTPEPEPTPVVPTKEIVLEYTWGDIFDGKINSDSIKKYTDMEDVKFVFLDLETISATSNYRTIHFHAARDTLQTRFDISPKVRGSGTIYVNPEIGAQVPDGELAGGMCVSDSAWYASKGYQIKRFPGVTSRSSR